MTPDTMPELFSPTENITRQIRNLSLSFEHKEITWSEFQADLETLLTAKKELIE